MNPGHDDPALQARALTRRYAETDVVDAVDLTVRSGELFGFLGPNGAGKTTTIAMLCTLLRPSSGHMNVAGVDVLADPREVRRRIGMVFQETSLDGGLTAQENLVFHAELYGMDRQAARRRIAEMLDLVGLAERRHSLVRTFSGGMKRRLEIARGLLHRPRLLFLDEPTLGLDPQTRAQIWDHLRYLRRSQAITVFVTTHYLDEAEHCDRIAIIDHGRIIALDTPAALKSVLGADRIRLHTTDDEAAAAVLASRFRIAATPTGEGLRVRVPDAAAALPRLCEALHASLRSIEVSRPSLDDVFLHYTGRAIRDPGSRATLARGGAATVGGEPTPPRGANAGSRRAGTAIREPAPPCGPTAGSRPEGTAIREPAPTWQVRGVRELRAALVVWRREMVHFVRGRTRLAITLLQPVVYLLVLGTGLSAFMRGGQDYRTFLFPGVLAMTVQIPAIMIGASIVIDRDTGFLREMLIAPVERAGLLAGKCAGGATIATCQGILVLTLAGTAHVPYQPELFARLIGETALIAFALTTLTALLAVTITQADTFHAALNLALMPMTFLSGAFFPVTGLPAWLTTLVMINPLTWTIDPLRQTIGQPSHGLHAPIALELVVTALIGLAALTLAARRFSHSG
jgi:daunorubicin resistance ABC transporter ATP-binding subunit/daunorubicin resistance ABC transporter membrane protein